MSDGTQCAHKSGYTLRGEGLVCHDCGQPSPSERWRQRVYGATQEDVNERAWENSNGGCGHSAGFRLEDGELTCVVCGAPSFSDKWHRNVYQRPEQVG